MLDFKPLTLSQKAQIDTCLHQDAPRGCEYSFVNLYLWGRQTGAQFGDQMIFFSQFNRKSVYLFPVGRGDKKPALDAIIEDASQRGIPCRLVGLTQDDCALLEQLYPGRLRYHFDRDSFDYVYDIHDLSELKGRKFQRKRNHLNRFKEHRPNAQAVPITQENMGQVEAFIEQWYSLRLQENPHADFHMERVALSKALRQYRELEMEGLLLIDGDEVLAVTMGSRLNADTFDIHFEKALDSVDGAYVAINNSFARFLRDKHPQLQFLNREDDMGLEGLRKAKLSYCPHHMVEKSWACLLEDCYEY